MASSRWDRFAVDFPERWRRWFDAGDEPEGWLRIEERHEDDTLVISAEVPGIDPEKDVDVTVTDHTLQISVTREERSDAKKDGYRTEFRYGQFRRSLPLPSGIDKDSVKAQYKDGILEVKIPWPAEAVGSGATKVPIARA